VLRLFQATPHRLAYCVSLELDKTFNSPSLSSYQNLHSVGIEYVDRFE